MPGIVNVVISSRLIKTWNPEEKRPRSYTGIINCILNSSPSVHRSVELSSLIKETWFHSRWRLLLEAATGHSAGINFTWDVRPQLVYDTVCLPPAPTAKAREDLRRGAWETVKNQRTKAFAVIQSVLKKRGNTK